METQVEKNLLSRDEVQKLLRVSGTTLTKITKAGKLTFYKVGRRILFDREELLTEIRNSKRP